MKNYRYREDWPIRKLQAQFEYYTLQTLGRACMRRYADTLEMFFRLWPKRKHPHEYTRIDVEDFKVVRRRQGMANTTINREVSVLCAFWNWLIARGINVRNIASIPPLPRPKRNKARLTLTDFERLEKEFVDPRLRQFVQHIIEGKKQNESAKLAGLTQRYLSIRFGQAASRAGLAWVKPRNLRGLLRGTAVEMLADVATRKTCDTAEVVCSAVH